LYPRAPANSSSSTVAELKQRRARGSAATGAAERIGASLETDRNIFLIALPAVSHLAFRRA
jgi:hypothetical protein